MADVEHKQPLHIIGIDPGAHGGVACISTPPGQPPALVWGVRMPLFHHAKKPAVDSARLAHLLTNAILIDHRFDRVVVVIEQVHAMPRQGVASSFQFGRNFGAIEAIALASGLPTHFVTPNAWKRGLNLSSDKRGSLDRARQVFGSDAALVFRHLADEGIAEAALIAYYWATRH